VVGVGWGIRMRGGCVRGRGWGRPVFWVVCAVGGRKCVGWMARGTRGSECSCIEGRGDDGRCASIGGLGWGQRVGRPRVWFAGCLEGIRGAVDIAVRGRRIRIIRVPVRGGYGGGGLLGGRRGCRLWGDILGNVVLGVGLVFWGRCGVVGGRFVGKVEGLERGKTKVAGGHVWVGRGWVVGMRGWVRGRIAGVVLRALPVHVGVAPSLDRETSQCPAQHTQKREVVGAHDEDEEELGPVQCISRWEEISTPPRERESEEKNK